MSVKHIDAMFVTVWHIIFAIIPDTMKRIAKRTPLTNFTQEMAIVRKYLN